MNIVYFSKTNNVKRFCAKLPYQTLVGDEKLVCSEPYILITYTTGFGEIPNTVAKFLENADNQNNLKAVLSSGNKNWGANYAKAADLIAKKYSVPVLMKFELSGNVHDVEKFKIKYEELVNNE